MTPVLNLANSVRLGSQSPSTVRLGTVLVWPPAQPPQLVLTQLAADNFQRANASTLGAGWTPTIDGSMLIVSNEAKGGGSANLGNYRNGETYTADHYSEVTIGAVNNQSGGLIGPTTRNVSNEASYLAGLFNGAIDFFKRTASTSFNYAQVAGTTNGIPVAQGDRIGLLSQGNRHTILKNRVGVASYRDTELSGGTPGLQSGGTANSLSGWSGGNAVTGAHGPALFSDSFNRANGGATVGQSGIAVMTGYPAVDPPIVSNELNVSSGSHAAFVCTGAFNTDQWTSLATGSVPVAPGSAGFEGLMTRVNPALNSGMLAMVFGVGGNNLTPLSFSIYRMDIGTSHFLGGADIEPQTGPSLEPVGAVYEFLSVGNRHSWRADGHEIVAVTDSTYSTGKPGAMLYPPSTGDNFAAGNV